MTTSDIATQTLARPPRVIINRRTGKPMPSNSLANLKPPYKPGENGHGRVYPLKERLLHALDHPLEKPKPDAPAGDHIVYATLKGAKELVPVAFRETWDRAAGKVPADTPSPLNLNIMFVIGKGYRELPQLAEGSDGNSD